MNESLWMYFFMMMGIFGVVMINVFGQVLLSNEQNYYLLKESTEAAMYDSIDLNAYRGDGEWEIGEEGNSCVPKVPGTIKIIREKFVESFARRFANSANLDRQYRVIFNDIDECPPKVSVSLIASERFSMLEIFNVTYDADTSIINNLTGIIEADVKTLEPSQIVVTSDECSSGTQTANVTYSEWGTCNYSTNTQSRYKYTQYSIESIVCGTTTEIEQKQCFEESVTPGTSDRYCTRPFTEYTPVVTYGEYGRCNSLTGKKKRQKVTEYLDGTRRCGRTAEFEYDTCSITGFTIPEEIDICDHPEMFPQKRTRRFTADWSECVNNSHYQTYTITYTARGQVCREEPDYEYEWCPSPTPSPTQAPQPTATARPSQSQSPRPPSQQPTQSPSPSQSQSCFLKGTPVLTSDGYKNIEDIEVGDIVLSYNDDKDINEYNEVTETFIHKDIVDDLYTLTIEGEDLQVSAIHPFYIKRVEDGEETIDYIAADRIKIGDQVRYSDGTFHTVDKIYHKFQKDTYYNIEVDNNHNYYVSYRNILVHNKGAAHCFPKGTLVKTDDGYKNIEDIEVGDKVLTYNEKENVNELKTVQYKYIHEDVNDDLYTIVVDGFNFEVTGLHAIYIKRHMMPFINYEGYMAAKYLQLGDQIRYSDGTFHTIEEISYVNETSTYYNLSVADNHNFFVTEKEITVHNNNNILSSNFPAYAK